MLRHCRKGLNRFQARRSLLLPALFAPFALDLGTPFLRRANTVAPHPSTLAPDSGEPAGRYFAPARLLGDKKGHENNREKNFHFEYQVLLPKIPSEIDPVSD